MTEQATVLVVEDDETTLEFLCDNLKADRYEALPAQSAHDAFRVLTYKRVDLMLLDVNLPDASGFEVCRRVREADGLNASWDPRTPIIMLSGRAADNDRVRGFDRGADDYVTKPFHYPELVARIGAVLTRGHGHRLEGVVRAGDLVVDPVSRLVRVGEHQMELSAKEFALLRLLASEPRRVFTKKELLERVWGFKSMGNTRTLYSHASRLRKKINLDGRRYVVNVWGVGYRLVEEAR